MNENNFEQNELTLTFVINGNEFKIANDLLKYYIIYPEPSTGLYIDLKTFQGMIRVSEDDEYGDSDDCPVVLPLKDLSNEDEFSEGNNFVLINPIYGFIHDEKLYFVDRLDVKE